MASADVLNVEETLRNLAITKRMRVNEFFKDYDNLRSGYVTRSQFFRCLGQTLGVKLTPQQEAALEKKYNLKNTNRLNYRVFCNEINKNFRPQDVTHNPRDQEVHPSHFLGSERTVNVLDQDQEEKLDTLIKHLRDYYTYHMLSIRNAYKDFDVHNIGVVTETQFYRNFPGPNDVDEKDLQLLVMKYRDPQKDGLINYMNFDRDIQSRALPPTELLHRSMTNTNIFNPTKDQSLNQILDRIRTAVYKFGIRTIDFFKDYDSLRSGIVTEPQFTAAMVLCLGNQAQLTQSDIQQIIAFYRTPDGRVQYREFTDMMENVFNIPHLEKKPSQMVEQPAKGTLYRTLAPLSESEEARVKEILTGLASKVKKNRIMMYQYLKDFDRSKAYTRLMTPSQFYRSLHFLALDVPELDHKLLCRKFADPITGDINYPAFVQAIDEQYVGHTTEDVEMQDKFRGREVTEAKPPLPEPIVNFDELIARIRHHVMTNRLRTGLFFEDYDQLRSGSITKSRFRRGLSSLGLSKIGQHDLTPGQFDMLCDRYQDPQKANNVLWTKFVEDIECVFTIPNLESAPTLRVPDQEMYLVPRPGTADWEQASDVHKTMIADIMHRLSEKVAQRRILCKPAFQDFDTHNRGLITVSQFRQALNTVQLLITEHEMKAIEAKYVNDQGFSYLKFLEDIEPTQADKLMYMERMAEVRNGNVRKIVPEFKPAVNLEELLLKLKSIVARKRMRPIEFMKDFDKLRSGRIVKNLFRRALDASGYGLQESEMAILEDHYQSPKGADYIDYMSFCAELESVFTINDLEKTPLAECTQFQPPEEWTMNKLDDEGEKMVEACLHRIADKVGKRRMQLFPLFEDYDVVKTGYVSRSQFTRVLTELELVDLVGARDFDVLWSKFDVRVGGRNDMNYIAFCDVIHKMANIHPRKP